MKAILYSIFLLMITMFSAIDAWEPAFYIGMSCLIVLTAAGFIHERRGKQWMI